MKSLKTLIKLNKQQLDALRRSLVALEGQKANLDASIERLKAEVQAETRLAQSNVELARYFGAFTKAAQQKEADIRTEMAKLDKQMDTLREEIRGKFSELKTFEIALERQKEREKEKQAKQEAEQLDEIAMQQFVRKGEP